MRKCVVKTIDKGLYYSGQGWTDNIEEAAIYSSIPATIPAAPKLEGVRLGWALIDKEIGYYPIVDGKLVRNTKVAKIVNVKLVEEAE